jgi:hypothetical protein
MPTPYYAIDHSHFDLPQFQDYWTVYPLRKKTLIVGAAAVAGHDYKACSELTCVVDTLYTPGTMTINVRKPVEARAEAFIANASHSRPADPVPKPARPWSTSV